MGILELVSLPALMALSNGRRDVVVGLLDGPVALAHPELAGACIQEIPGVSGRCAQTGSVGCRHGTFVAGMLVARRGSSAPAICPDCSVLVRPIFPDAVSEDVQVPSATPEQVAVAIRECVGAGAWVLNLSAATGAPSTRTEQQLHQALDDAARLGVLVVAAGNQGTLGSSAITRHPWVIPVVGYGADGRVMDASNLGSSAGKRGLGAPGEGVTSLAPEGEPVTLAGTSFAAAIVTGAVALLWSLFPRAPAVAVKNAVLSSPARRRRSVVPPLLDTVGAYQLLSQTQGGHVHERRATEGTSPGRKAAAASGAAARVCQG